jgi:hypothetical protein
MPLDTWSKKEKEISRKIFDSAYQKEYDSIRNTVLKMTKENDKLNEIWKIGNYIYEKRKEIDHKYDYRYSILLHVFGQLLSEHWFKIEDLDGLDEEKIKRIICLSKSYQD